MIETVLTLPFGKHKGEPLSEVPMSYLMWALSACKLSSGLRRAVADEVARRGFTPPPAPPPRPEPCCHRCGCPRLLYQRCEDTLGRVWLRRRCAACGGNCGHAPRTAANLAVAAASASATPLLDVLTLAEREGVGLVSDGRAASFASWEDYRRAGPELRDRLDQCKATLGRLMGDIRP